MFAVVSLILCEILPLAIGELALMSCCHVYALHSSTRMWANAQRDGRHAEHRWRPLFNAANFG